MGELYAMLEKEIATTLVFWPGESHGWRSLVDYSPWGCIESDKTDCEYTHMACASYLKKEPVLWTHDNTSRNSF